ncbi:MAG: hypothetical protein QXR57_06725 [Metallosphaera sp.]
MNGIKAGYLKLKELVGDAWAFKQEDQYTLVGVNRVSCKEKTKIVDAVLNEVYKYGDEFYITVLLLSIESFERIKGSLGEDITNELRE